MAKSKLVKANKRVEDAVTGTFHRISDGVVNGYTKIEDRFVDQYLTKEGESITDAKKRLKREQFGLLHRGTEDPPMDQQKEE